MKGVPGVWLHAKLTVPSPYGEDLTANRGLPLSNIGLTTRPSPALHYYQRTCRSGINGDSVISLCQQQLPNRIDLLGQDPVCEEPFLDSAGRASNPCQQ